MKKITVKDLSIEEKLRLLCSDGFWEYVLEEEMEEELRLAKDPEDWLCRMREHLRGRIPQNNDNNTAAVVWLTQE